MQSAAASVAYGIGKVLPRFGHFATGMLIPNLLGEDPDEQLLDGVACSYAGTPPCAGLRQQTIRQLLAALAGAASPGNADPPQGEHQWQDPRPVKMRQADSF
jgi:hypothetical protein